MATPSSDAGTDLVPVQPPALAVIDRGTLATSEVIARTMQIREVMEAVMKKDVHYGVIPGTQKPTMYQPGADVLNVTFRIAPKIGHVEDLSNEDEVRYRITMQGIHQVTGELLAEGIGECSSNEEKYRWRRPVCDAEFNETDPNRRREKWARGNGAPYKSKQVRTSPADVSNTVLKMAVKRGKIAMTLNATAASDVFAQDLEDLSEELRDSLAEEHATDATPVPMPQRKTEESKPAAPAAATASSPQPLRITKVEKVESSKTRGKADADLPAGTKRVFFFLITDSTGRVCSTWSEDVYLHCGKFADDKTVVDMSTEAGDPWPRLTEIAPARATGDPS